MLSSTIPRCLSFVLSSFCRRRRDGLVAVHFSRLHRLASPSSQPLLGLKLLHGLERRNHLVVNLIDLIDSLRQFCPDFFRGPSSRCYPLFRSLLFLRALLSLSLFRAPTAKRRHRRNCQPT